MKRSLLLIINLMLLSGCYDAPDKLKPMPWIFNMMPKDAPNNYKKGWRDGCESGLADMTNAMYKTFYTFKQNAALRDDATYYTTWKTTYNFCRHYAYGTLRESNQRLNLPNQPNEFYSSFMGADGGMFSDSSALHMWGPVDWLLPFQKIGPIGGDPWIATSPGKGNVAGIYDETSILGGNGAGIDYSDGYFQPGSEFNGMTWDFSRVPFFDPTDAWGK